ncbi:hypothetical protein QLL95_gp0478 [Cotonvirus japonicus]|uniref:AAA+ ATPase domain-containing protein n=1 Tax=Cotonvirus japonicus TaxID=2811091 RepID=A0ABM7NU04_9VIRU|nr:hypothetical protein QLL95_gp0478 [Cotonvirus japonicus]BCS83645.1 hypothetical protein [Cotonvirus japonicus]
MFSYFLVMLIPYLSIIWSIGLIFFTFFGLQLYKIKNQQKTIIVTKKLSKRVALLEEENPLGWIFGWPYICYIYETDKNNTSSYEIYMFTTKKFYENMFETQDAMNSTNENENKKIIINMYDRTGNYFYLRYLRRDFIIDDYKSNNNQIEPIKKISKIFKNKKKAVVFLHGEPGCGKSMISLLLAKKLNASICDSFNPTEPGDDFANLYSYVNPTKDNPLIVVLEEFDVFITEIHNNSIIKHESIPIQIKNKSDYNKFMDRIDRGIYPWLILILTSNKNPSFIKELDSSYMRKGRVDLIIEINNPQI